MLSRLSIQQEEVKDSDWPILSILANPRQDDTRAWGPPYAKYLDGKEGPGESAYYLGVSLRRFLYYYRLTLGR